MTSPPQLTARAIILSVILAALLAAANAYLGLFAGLTIASAIPAAVVSMAVLRALGGGHILENNIVQTGASAGSSIAAGVIFTIPALVIIGYWPDFKYMWVLAIAGLGGVLGVLFSVPLRRSLICEANLAFPEGKAAAEVLRAGENPKEGIKVLASAAALGGIGKIAAANGFKFIPDTAAWAGGFGKSIFYLGTNLSPALLGVGYIVGFNVGAVVVAGGILSWDIAIPVFSGHFRDTDPVLAAKLTGIAIDDAYTIWSAKIRYLGVGAMLIGGIWTLISLRSSLLSGIRSGLAAARAGAGKVVAETERDLPMKAVLIGVLLFTLPLGILYYAIVSNVAVTVTMTIIMVIAGFLFSSVSAYMAGLVGSSNNPVSGITISTILFAAVVLMLLMGRTAELGPVAAIMIGAVVCCAASVAGDNLQDLKAGYLIGASPWRQQVMLAIGAISCALVMAPVLNLLQIANGIGDATPEHPHPLRAPQATLMASVARGMFGGELPWNFVWIGAAVGAVVIIIDTLLKRNGAKFRVPVLAAAVGIYLPLDNTMPIFLGGIIAHIVEQVIGGIRSEEQGERAHRKGVLFSAGLITGEALMGIVIAFFIWKSGNPDVLTASESLQFGQWVGLILLAVVGFVLFRAARGGARAALAEGK
jgi:putative OPT family oligopeptide transporter